MAISSRSMSIAGSCVLSLLLIIGAYVLSSPGGTLVADAGSTEQLLKEYAEKDTDADGLEDWKERIYGTDPQNPQSVQAGIDDGEAVAQGLVKPRFETQTSTTQTTDIPGIDAGPETLTDKFSRELLEKYLLSRGAEAPSSEDIYTFVQSAVAKLPEPGSSNTYGPTDVRIQGSGAEAVNTYALALGKVFELYGVSTEKNTPEYYYDLVVEESPTAMQMLKTHAKAYNSIAKNLLLVPTPAETASAHLRLVNALAYMSEVTTDLGVYTTDPLKALVAAEVYLDVQREFALSMQNMATVLKNNL